MTFKRKPYARTPTSAPKPLKGVNMPMVGMGVVASPKIEKLKGGKDEREHKDKLSQLGCMVCARLGLANDPGPVELHHIRTGGWGKGDYRTLTPLCPEHHRGSSGVHGLGTKGFAAHYGFDQQDLLNDALALLTEK